MFLDPKQAIFVGDSVKYDIFGSRSVEMKSCLIDREVTTVSNEMPQPDLVVNSLSQLSKAMNAFC
jgi:FMN phosphatase YigB (HAD superfamily)